MSLTRLQKIERRGNSKLVAMASCTISAPLTEHSVHMCKHQATTSGRDQGKSRLLPLCTSPSVFLSTQTPQRKNLQHTGLLEAHWDNLIINEFYWWQQEKGHATHTDNVHCILREMHVDWIKVNWRHTAGEREQVTTMLMPLWSKSLVTVVQPSWMVSQRFYSLHQDSPPCISNMGLQPVLHGQMYLIPLWLSLCTMVKVECEYNQYWDCNGH